MKPDYKHIIYQSMITSITVKFLDYQEFSRSLKIRSIISKILKYHEYF